MGPTANVDCALSLSGQILARRGPGSQNASQGKSSLLNQPGTLAGALVPLAPTGSELCRFPASSAGGKWDLGNPLLNWLVMLRRQCEERGKQVNLARLEIRGHGTSFATLL